MILVQKVMQDVYFQQLLVVVSRTVSKRDKLDSENIAVLHLAKGRNTHEPSRAWPE